jgi:Ca-activated chloride channel family protein
MSRSLPMISDDELVPGSLSAPIADDEAGFGCLRTDKGHLPLESMDVRGRVDGLLARVTVRQTFVNALDEPMEATYIFPLPDRAAVTRFRMGVAGRVIEGVLEERGQAREQYDRAIAEGRRAAIAEEDRPGVFNLRVGNLMPGERAAVELMLCGVLPYSDGAATFRFPLVVAPRYIPGVPLPGPSVGDGTALDTDAVPDASRITPPVLLPGFPNPVRLSLEVELHDGGAEVEDVRCSLHAVNDETRAGYRVIRLHPGERLNRDFILRFRLGGRGIRSTMTLHPDATGDEGTFALTVVPPIGGAASPERARDVVFVLDRSGSMEGWKMVAARRAVARMIDTLNDADRFGVLAFDNVVETPPGLAKGLVAATDRHRFRAVEYLAKVDSRGGTEMAGPIGQAVKLLDPSRSDDRDRILVLITDGQVGNEDQILRILGDRLRKIRIFTLGIDRSVNEAFLRRLAERGGGSCELVESEDRLDEVMAAVHRRIGTPLLTGLSLGADGMGIEPGEIVPRRLPDLFAGSPLLILGRYRGRPTGAVTVHATDADARAWSEPIPAEVRENPAIAAAWARGQVRQLEDRYAAQDGDLGTLEKAIVAISLRFQVLCRFTAYVAIDRSQVANKDGSLHRITQPVEQPEGWDEVERCVSGPVPSALHTRLSMSRRGGFPRAGSAFMPSGPVAYDRSAPDAQSLSPPPPSPEAFAVDDSDDACSLYSLAELSAERVASHTLVEHLRRGKRMQPPEAAALMADLAEAVQRLHERGIVLGGIEPSDVLLDDNGRPELLATGEGPLSASAAPGPPTMDTAVYTAPERLVNTGAPRDPRSDIYSLGAILYEILTGRRPFRGRSLEDLIAKVSAAIPTPLRQFFRSVPAELEAICLKAMARNPDDRYATAAELATALRQFLNPKARKGFWK